MVEMTAIPRWLILGGAAALALATGAGGYWLGQLRPVAEPAQAEAKAASDKAEPRHNDAPAELVLDAAQIRASGIEVEAVSDVMFAGEVTASGRIVPAANAEAQTTARVAGTVVRLVAKLGDRVRVGTPLAVIDSREVAEARAAHARAARSETLADATFAREATLYRKRVTAQAEYQQAAAARDAARVDTRLAAENLRALGVSAGSSGSRTFTLTAPIAGAVVAVDTRAGETVDAAKALFRIADQRIVWAELLVPARELGRVAVGGRATLEAQGEGHSHTGRIKSLSPTIDPATGAATAIVEIGNTNGELAVGKLVTARIASRSGSATRGALSVPRDAVQEVDGKSLVFVRTQRGFTPREVTRGPGTGARTAVLSGLKPGERIAVANAFILRAELGKGEAEHDH
ncbi:efflux RND transporter periplasmic adaptor subunit [Glacieibacterium frigidum]|uniref:Efflux RND transporter periplasmic adaptor subunit n=1 Tax=Glacieibacterium frigidum TaxID=2593303 RepID=A0A552U9Q5_9SPHN|nr:efflux RND transporter periplasmic adaptor subunit [Glacieibacterium frigidum]TRW14954.1 efflux RND transporter periplasmic adaptor subunit [Glacieibacterium frigidum]